MLTFDLPCCSVSCTNICVPVFVYNGLFTMVCFNGLFQWFVSMVFQSGGVRSVLTKDRFLRYFEDPRKGELEFIGMFTSFNVV